MAPPQIDRPYPDMLADMPHIHILMCTWNGAAYLAAQLQSFLDQSHRSWSLWVRDDRSTDATRDILQAFQRAHPDHEVRIIAGDGHGSAANFLSLLADPALPPGHVAFSDQDDVWLPHKLARAVSELARAKAESGVVSGYPQRPAVYASRSLHTDARLRHPRPSVLHPRPPGFANALVQNILGGNTIVLNPAAVALLRTTCAAALADAHTGRGVPFHDWWVYLVMTGAGGIVINDPEPGLLYRQHDSNVLGASRGLRGGMARALMLGNSRYADWIDRNLAALRQVDAHLTPAHRSLTTAFAALRQQRNPLTRISRLNALGIHRQMPRDDLLLRLLALTGRL